MAKIVKFDQKDFDDTKKSSIIAEESDEPTALAFTDFSKPTPVLEGEDAERFIRIMEENEKKAKERAKTPPTLEELKDKLSFEKMFLEWDKETIRKREEKIKELENKIKELEKI
jgi:valyl-tRNA synthetase